MSVDLTSTHSKQFQDTSEYPPDLYPYRIRNWRKFQHYHNRSAPPWIKLHFSILSSEDWVMLDDASKLLAVVIMLIASKHDGYIPSSVSPAYLRRVAYLDQTPNINPLIECGFIENRLASARPDTARPEQSRVEQKRTDKKVSKDISIISPTSRLSQEEERGLPMEGWMEEFWVLYPRKIGKKDTFKILERIVKAGDVSRETLMAGVQRYRDYAKTKDIKYIKHPSVWLNKGCWDDEFAPAEYMNGDSMKERTSRERLSDALQRLGSGSFSETLDLGLPKLTDS